MKVERRTWRREVSNKFSINMQSESRRDCGAVVSSCLSLHCLLSSHVLILYSLFVSLLTCLRAANTKQRLFVIAVYSTLVSALLTLERVPVSSGASLIIVMFHFE